MRLKIDIEVTPMEVRDLLGLPDVKGLQEDLVGFVRSQVGKGAGSVEDAVGLLKTVGSESVGAASNLQKRMAKGFSRFMSGEMADEVDSDMPQEKKK